MTGAVSAVTGQLDGSSRRGERSVGLERIDMRAESESVVLAWWKKKSGVSQRRAKLGENPAGKARHRKGVSIKPSSTRRTRPDRPMLNFIKNGQRERRCARLTVGWVWAVGGR